jgi:hypothetical protein
MNMNDPLLGILSVHEAEPPERASKASKDLGIHHSTVRSRRRRCFMYRRLYAQHSIFQHKTTSWQEALVCDLRISDRKKIILEFKIQCPEILNPSKEDQRKKRRELRASVFGKRIDPLYQQEIAAHFAELGGSHKVYQFLKNSAQKVFLTCLPTRNEVSKANASIYDAAKKDLDFLPTPEGIKASLRRIVELAAFETDTFEPHLPANKKSEAERKIRSSTEFRLREERVRFQGTLRVRRFKISLDARKVRKTPDRYHTETMIACMESGEEGEKTCQLLERIKTVGLYSGKDTESLVERNLTPTWYEMSELELNGIVFDVEKKHYFGVRERLEDYIKKGLIIIDKDTGIVKEWQAAGDPQWQVSHRYEFEKVEFFFATDMAAAFSICKHGGKHDDRKRFCVHCNEHASHRTHMFGFVHVEKDVSVSQLAREHDMHVFTLLAINKPSGDEFLASFTLDPDPEPTEIGTTCALTPINTAKTRFVSAAPSQKRTAAGFNNEPGSGKPKRAAVVRLTEAPAATMLISVAKMIDSALLQSWEKVDDPDHRMIPRGTKVRVIRKQNIERASEALSKTWLQGYGDSEKKLTRLLFCTLHADMRLSEGLLLMIFRKLKHEPSKLIVLNNLLKDKCMISDQFYKDKDSGIWRLKGLIGPDCKKLRNGGNSICFSLYFSKTDNVLNFSSRKNAACSSYRNSFQRLSTWGGYLV